MFRSAIIDGNYRSYDYLKSSARIREILDQPGGTFEETDSLPNRERLTFTNGFYGQCTAVFVDIRNSSGLTAKHQRPTLAKIYRAFVSEMVAVLNSSLNVREVNIVGDCVWAVYNTPYRNDIDEAFGIAAYANTLRELLNHHYAKNGIDSINIGVGIDWGRALMIKAGYNGSGINDVVYMGEVVNQAAHLAHEAGRAWGAQPVLVSSRVQENLNDHNKNLLTQRYINGLGTVYGGSIVMTDMAEWIKKLS